MCGTLDKGFGFSLLHPGSNLVVYGREEFPSHLSTSSKKEKNPYDLIKVTLYQHKEKDCEL